jgi:hypothetical protein
VEGLWCKTCYKRYQGNVLLAWCPATEKEEQTKGSGAKLATRDTKAIEKEEQMEGLGAKPAKTIATE